MNGDIARSLYGVRGRNISIGFISDSFDNLQGAEADIINGDLPPEIRVLQDLGGDGSDEGRALMQVVHDTAPSANFLFHSAFSDSSICEASYANAIDNLVGAGAGIIVSDASCLEDPMFQEGQAAQAINRAKNAGIPVFIAAGNEARRSYETSFRDSGVGDDSGGTYHDFNPAPDGVSIWQNITLESGNALDLTFQWDEPSFNSANDLDIYLFDRTGTTLLAGSANDNLGNAPLENLFFFNDTSETQFKLAISKREGRALDLMKYVVFGGGRNFSIDDYYNPLVSSLYGVANAAGAFTVGAASYLRTPRFGIDPAEVRNFSSAGGSPLLFDGEGKRLPNPIIRPKPDIIAPDGGCTSFFGIDTGGGCFSFPGTSAAVAHAAGVAALMLEAAPHLSPDRVYDILRGTARDMDDPATWGFDVGFDYKTGYGFIDAVEAVGEAKNSIPEPSNLWGLFLLGISLVTARRWLPR